MVNNRAARQYMQEVKAMLPDAGKQKKAILNRIRTTVEEYLAGNPNAVYEEIVSRLGSPNQIAASCLEEMDTAELMKQLRTKKKMVCIVTAAALVIVMLWVGVVFSALVGHNGMMNGYFSESMVEEIDAQ